jgi:hypothetical protein
MPRSTTHAIPTIPSITLLRPLLPHSDSPLLPFHSPRVLPQLRTLKCIFIVHGVYAVRGPSIECTCYFMLIDVQQSIFSRNAKW